MASVTATSPDTLVTLKVNIDGSNRRFKLPLCDLGASTLPDKLHFLLAIPPTSDVVIECYSDSAAAFVALDANNAFVYKQLYRAAKAKLKLRLRVSVKDKTPVVSKPAIVQDEQPSPASLMEQEPALPSALELEAVAEPQNPPLQYTMYPGSVSDLKRGFEQLLSNHLRPTTPHSLPQITATSCCAQASRSVSSMFKHATALEGSLSLPFEIPHIRGTCVRDKWFAELANMAQDRQNATRKSAMTAASTVSVYSVYCNNCNDAVPHVHYHCGTCDDGDFDLCQSCVNAGAVCGSKDHWLDKRFVKNGKVINSTAEIITPKPVSSASKTTLVAPEALIPIATRTCNNCFSEMTEEHFVTCITCPDFDLCIPCHVGNNHGHHPNHAFVPAVEETILDITAQSLLAPGRNYDHNAICDGCDRYIYGVRNKCLDCPDTDFCASCIANASSIHPNHRFVPLYEAIKDASPVPRNIYSIPVVKEEPKEVVAESEPEAKGSQMIFPKLEKESPITSIHEEASTAAPETETETEDVINEFVDFADEPLDNESEDGFMTDDEYDILDASDEEYLAESMKFSSATRSHK